MSDGSRTSEATRPARPGPVGTAANLLRGFLIGMAELVPGVSGGTVALVVGVYERLIGSGSQVVNAAVTFIAGPDRANAASARLRRVDWWLILPMLAAMAVTVFTMSGVMHAFVENHANIARGLFLGMVLASVLVPVSMLGRQGRARAAHRAGHTAMVLVIAAATFLLLSLPGIRIENLSWWIIVLAGAIAVCALVLPGLSGSFILLTFGMYTPTLQAVSERNLGYIGLFALGAVLGLSSFVKVLNHLLLRHRRTTLLVMIGLMLGSVRALWPWQSESSALLAPGSDWLPVAAVFAAGAAVVVGLWLFERRSISSAPIPA